MWATVHFQLWAQTLHYIPLVIPNFKSQPGELLWNTQTKSSGLLGLAGQKQTSFHALDVPQAAAKQPPFLPSIHLLQGDNNVRLCWSAKLELFGKRPKPLAATMVIVGKGLLCFVTFYI